MEQIRLMPTKAERGFKLVVNDEWFYISNDNMVKLMNGEKSSVTFTAHKEFKTDIIQNNLKELTEQITSTILQRLPTKQILDNEIAEKIASEVLQKLPTTKGV
ncbi:MAG: hypothetical protein ACTSQY_03240 [Candidatus Odinarchaeia archaeon]